MLRGGGRSGAGSRGPRAGALGGCRELGETMLHSPSVDERASGEAGDGRRAGFARRFTLSLLAMALCFGTLGGTLVAALATAQPAGASGTGVTEHMDCWAKPTGGPSGETTAATDTVTHVATSTPPTVAPGGTYTLTFAPTGVATVPPTTSGYTIAGLYTVTERLAVPAGATIVSGPTVVSQGYYYKPTKPATHTAFNSTVSAVADANAPGGYVVKEYTSTNIPGGDDYVDSTISVVLKAASPTKTKLGVGLVSVPPTGSNHTSTDPAFQFKTKVTGVPLYGTIVANLNCWPFPNPQPAFVNTGIIDNVPPAITIATPGNTSQVVVNSSVHSNFSCLDTPSYGDGIKSCTATNTGNPLADGAKITTSVLGTHTVSVHAVNNSTVASTQVSHYKVIQPPYNLVPPTVAVTSPANGAQYLTGATVKATFSCTAGTGTTITSCTGTVATGAAVNTTAGYHTFTVKATDKRGNPSTETVGYYVRASETPVTTTSGDVSVTSTESSSNFSCSLFHQLNKQGLDGLTNKAQTCVFGNHEPEATWRVTAPASNGGQVAVGDKLTVAEQIYRPGANASTGTTKGGYDSGPYKETLTVSAPSGTKITGPITTSATGLPSATYGGTGSATNASACNYNYAGAVGTGSGNFCTNATGNLGSTTNSAAGSTTVGAYGSTTVNTLFSTKVKSTSNGKSITTGTLHVTSDSGSAKSGRLEVQTSTGVAVIAYTGHSSTSFTGVTVVSGSGTVSTGGFVRAPTTVHDPIVLPIASTSGFMTSGTNLATVATTTGSAVISYTGSSTSNTTCGKNPCLTGVTLVSGAGTIAKSNAVAQVVEPLTGFNGATTGATGVLHAGTVAGFTGSGTLTVATATGPQAVSYTGTSTTAATCGSAACFTGVSPKTGAHGAPTVGGAISQPLKTVATFTGSGSLSVASVTGFHSPGLLKVATSNGTAWLSYTGTSGSSFTGVTTQGGATGTPTPGGGVVEAGLGSNGYTNITTVGGSSNGTTVSADVGGGGHLYLTSTSLMNPAGTVKVVTTNGVQTLTYTGISGNTLTGVSAGPGASGVVYSGALASETTATAVHGPEKIAGSTVSGWTWAVTASGDTAFQVVWNGSSCQSNTGTPKPTSNAACGTNANEKYGIDGVYIYVKYQVVVTSTGAITVPGTSAIAANQHDYDPGAGILTSKYQKGSTLFSTNAIAAPGISYTAVDPVPPTATLSGPTQGAVYGFGQTVTASYSCSDSTGGVTIASCTGVEDTGTPYQKSVANGGQITTTDLVHNEIHTFTVTATNSEGYVSKSYATFVTLASPPVLATQTVTVTSGQSVTVPFNYSGSYPADLATERIVSPPSHGTTAIQPTGKITYTNDNSPNASDSFQFTVTDTATNPANVETVHLTVQTTVKPTITVSTPPATGSGSYARHAAVDATYSCADNVLLVSCAAAQTVTGGTSPVADGAPIDTTSLIIGNTHVLKVTAVDWQGNTTVETVPYTVDTPAPVASNVTVTTIYPHTVLVHELTHVTSTFPLTEATVTVVTGPQHGTVTVEPSGSVLYNPTGASDTSVTTDSFTYTVKDTDGQVSNTATVGLTVYPVPVITSISPTAGPLHAGTTVTLTGAGFSSVTAVHVGTRTASSFSIVSNSRITAVVPAAPGGNPATTHITVTSPGGTSTKTVADTYTWDPAPTLTSISPSQGVLAGGGTLTVKGTGFTVGRAGQTVVDFGSTPGTNVAVNATGTQLTVTIPSAATQGTVNVTVATPGGTTTVAPADRYTYLPPTPQVTGVSPASGPAAGGGTVTVTGNSFTGATSVTFGSKPAPSFTVVSNTQITATAPSGTGGTRVNVTVTGPGGTSPVVTTDQYSYGPAVTGVSPASGSPAGGSSVTITGAQLAGATAVHFGSAPATFHVTSTTKVTATSPAATAGGTVDVTVTTPTGTSVTSAKDQFTYSAPAPTVSSVSPAGGPTAGGTSVTITGNGFSGATAVHFGANPASSVTVVSNTRITATAPAGSAGTVDVTVTTAGGTSATGANDHFTYGPSVSGVSPGSGTVQGGTSVTITGLGFTGATAVHFGATAATHVTVSSRHLDHRRGPGRGGGHREHHGDGRRRHQPGGQRRPVHLHQPRAGRHQHLAGQRHGVRGHLGHRERHRVRGRRRGGLRVHPGHGRQRQRRRHPAHRGQPGRDRRGHRGPPGGGGGRHQQRRVGRPVHLRPHHQPHLAHRRADHGEHHGDDHRHRLHRGLGGQLRLHPGVQLHGEVGHPDHRRVPGGGHRRGGGHLGDGDRRDHAHNQRRPVHLQVPGAGGHRPVAGRGHARRRQHGDADRLGPHRGHRRHLRLDPGHQLLGGLQHLDHGGGAGRHPDLGGQREGDRPGRDQRHELGQPVHLRPRGDLRVAELRHAPGRDHGDRQGRRVHRDDVGQLRLGPGDQRDHGERRRHADHRQVAGTGGRQGGRDGDRRREHVEDQHIGQVHLLVGRRVRRPGPVGGPWDPRRQRAAGTASTVPAAVPRPGPGEPACPGGGPPAVRT